MERYGIPSDHIFSSRDASFSGAVLSATRGQGVDLVINSLSGTLLQEGFNCLARFSRFVEIGKRDIEVNSDLEMSGFGRSATFIHLDLMQLQQYKGVKLQRVLTEIMRMFSHGQIEPVTPVTPATSASAASTDMGSVGAVLPRRKEFDGLGLGFDIDEDLEGGDEGGTHAHAHAIERLSGMPSVPSTRVSHLTAAARESWVPAEETTRMGQR